MGPAVYVMSVVGESPAVLSELLWHLRKVEKCRIAGVEVWATGRGEAALRSLWQSEEWAPLRGDEIAIPELLPASSPPASSYGARIHSLTANKRVLDDVRTETEAAAVSATLHDRVRELRRDLDDHIQLVGSLAGGRKTVSAALQTSFSLQAGVEDRLVHVLLGSEFERWLKAQHRLREYCCPTPQWASESGVSEAAQVVVYDVGFPRVKHLVSGRLKQILDNDEYETVWPKLKAQAGKRLRATLNRVDDRKWQLNIYDANSDGHPYPFPLGERAGALLAAISHHGGKPSGVELIRHLDTHDFGWAPTGTPFEITKTRKEAIRSAMRALRKRQSELPAGFEQFHVRKPGYGAPDIEVVGWKRSQAVFGV